MRQAICLKESERDQTLGDGEYCYSYGPFMQKWMGQGVFLVVRGYQFWGEHEFLWFPGVVGHGVSLPLDEVLKFAPFSKESMSHNLFDFEFLIPINYLGWWSGVVSSVFLCFMITR